MQFTKFSVKNPVLINLIMITVTVIGTFSLFELPREVNPEVEFHWVFVVVRYSGVSPEEIEKLITVPIEDELDDLDDVSLMTSTSTEGASVVQIRFENVSDGDFKDYYQEIKTRLNNFEELPEEIDGPFFQDFGSDDFQPMANIIISGDMPELEMKRIAEGFRDQIENVKNMGRVSIGGIRDREIWVEVDPIRLYSYNLALTNVINAIAQKNVNVPGGTIKVGRSEYTLRTIGEVDRVTELENVVIRKSVRDGGIFLKDVAAIKDTLEKAEDYSRHNGVSSVMLSTTKKSEGNAIDLVKTLRIMVDDLNKNLPAGTKAELINDMSAPVYDILSVLENNALLGLLLVLIVLWIFLGVRNAIFAAIGIPITFFATFIFLYFTGNSLNGTTLFGLVLVLGIIVDDAIIVIENCYRYIQKGYKPHIAAIIGTNEVIVPVLSATATTVAAFLPLMLVPGIMGEFFKVMPIVVTLALIASLFESFVVLPSHIAEWSAKKQVVKNKSTRFLKKIKKKYLRLLNFTLRRRLLAIASVFLLFVISLVLVVTYLGIDFFAGDELPQFFVWVTMPEGTTLEETDRIIREFENAAFKLPPDEIAAIVSNAGIMQTETEYFRTANVGQVIVELVPAAERTRNVESYINEMRGYSSNITGIKSVEFAGINTGPPVGAPIELKIKGDDFEKLQLISGEIQAYLGRIDGVSDIKDDFNFGKQELKIRVDERRAAFYGLDIQQIASSIRTAFEGTVATKYRYLDEEIDVLVKFDEKHTENLSSIEKIKLASPISNRLIPLKDIIDIEVAQSYTGIKRTDQQRTITLTADVDASVANSNAIVNQLLVDFANIGSRYPGYSMTAGGEFAEFAESLSGLWKLFLVGIFLIYVILGGQFKSFIQPLIILFTIPFAFIGAIFGLFLINSPFTFSTMYGIVALAGIVVNDALVLITFINNARQRGVGRWKSIMIAGTVRLRPIILTSITTIFGLLPMALGLGGKSQTWGPLATTIVGGLFFSTIFTLCIIPCLFAVVDDIKLFFGAKTLKPSPHLEEIEGLVKELSA